MGAKSIFLVSVKQYEKVMPGMRNPLVLYSITCALLYLRTVCDLKKKKKVDIQLYLNIIFI